MVFKKSLRFLVLCMLSIFFMQGVFSQQVQDQFIQIIEWENVAYATQYTIVLEQKNALNVWNIYDSFEVTTNMLELTLDAGEYRYNVTVYNVFGRAEQTSVWYNFTIEQALQPVISDIFPKELDLEDSEKVEDTTIITLSPKDVSEHATFFLKQAKGNDVLYGEFIGYDETGMMQIEFKTDELRSGDYELVIQDPSGLTSENVSEVSQINIERYNPSYLNISLGYSFAIFPPYENSLFSDYDFPSKNITARAKISYIPFVSPSRGSLGFELAAYLLHTNFTSKFRDVTGFIFPITANIAYHKELTERFVLATHLGAGITFLNDFVEHNNATQVPNAAGIVVNGGIAGQYFIGECFFVELGVDYMYSHFLDTNSFHTVLPTFSIGWRPNGKTESTDEQELEESTKEMSTDIIDEDSTKTAYVNISAGYTYALFPPIHNTLFGHFNFPVNNISARVKLTYAPFVFPNIGSLGFEVSSFVMYNTFEADNSEFSGFSVPVTLHIAYHTQLSKKFVLATNLGAGLNFLLHFHDSITNATMKDAAALAFTGGIAGQYFVNDNFFVELGVDYMYSYFLNNTGFYTILPTLSVGYKFN